MVAELAQRHEPVDPKIKLGTGGRFKKLKARLAARGARNPGALAAYIGRRAYGKKRFAQLGARGRAHAHAADPGEYIDLVGPKGYTHGWVYHGVGRPGHGAAVHTRRMSAAAARREGGSTRVGARLTMSEAANRASSKLSGRRASDYQHLGAARLHAAASRQAGISATAKAHHARMAAMHRGIAGRTPGKGTAAERKRPPPGPAALRPGETRTAGPGKAQGPSIGLLGKAAAGTHRLPKGSEALTKQGRAKAYEAGHALPPPSPGSPHGYPITSPSSWEDARRAVGRVGSPARREQLRQLLRRTAAQYGKTKALQKSWAASNIGRLALELAVAEQTFPITGPLDLIITRDAEDGSAVVRHRRGGGEVGRIRHSDDGQWRAARDGKDLSPHPRQRGALLELIGAHNHAAPSPYRRQAAQAAAAPPIQPKPVQTDLMKAYGIPATTSLAAATPTGSASDGPRVTTGLGPRGQTIYKKLRGRGFPHERAHSFARRAERKAAG
jgi:hypothetical protein